MAKDTCKKVDTCKKAFINTQQVIEEVNVCL